MELFSGFLLWISDVLGVKWVRQERNKFKKAVKAIAFLMVGIALVMVFFVFWYR